MSNGSKSIWGYIVIPGVITLAVTLIRLVGELRQWNETFFGRSAGGGGAVIGIVWLAFIFAVYFAIRLRKEGEVIASKGKSIGLALLAIALWTGGEMLILGRQDVKFGLLQVGGILVVLIALMVMRAAWPAFFRILFGYALAARIPVILIMYLAMQGNWKTHYDAAPPNLASADVMTKFLHLGLIPQLTFWVAFTVIFCGLLGLVAASLMKQKPAA